MKILTKNNVILAISNKADMVSNGIQLDDYVYGLPVNSKGDFIGVLPTIYEVETIPEGVGARTHCYNGSEFFTNERYLTYVNLDTTIEISEIKDIMADLTELILLGGM